MTDDSWIDSHLEEAYESRNGGDVDENEYAGWEEEYDEEVEKDEEGIYEKCFVCYEPIDYCQGHGVQCPHCGQYPSEQGHNPWCVTLNHPDTTQDS